jgi:sec-independent protein translocase protein TatA
VIVKVLKNIGSTEILVLAGILMLMFGGRKLPEFAKGVGDAVKEFKRAAKE